MGRDSGESELEKAMRRHPSALPDALIEDLAEALGVLGEVDAPVDLDLLASLQSIVAIEQTPSTHSGCLINSGGRLRIQVCAAENPLRQRFTIGHEICHTLLPGFTLEHNFRCNPGQATPRSHAGDTLNVEWLADVGASELLLPRRLVRDDFGSGPFGWATVEVVADRYRASLEATARRYVRLSPTPAIFINLSYAPSRKDPEPRLRVRSASWTPGLDVFIPPNKSIPDDHAIARTADGEHIDEITDLVALRVQGRYRIAARPYPYTNSEGHHVMRVLVLALRLPDSHVPVR